MSFPWVAVIRLFLSILKPYPLRISVEKLTGHRNISWIIYFQVMVMETIPFWRMSGDDGCVATYCVSSLRGI